MQETSFRRFGPVFGFIGAFALLAGFIAFVLFARLGTPLVYIPLTLGIVCLVLFGVGRAGQLNAMVRSRQAIYGTNVLIAATLSIGIAVVINAIVASTFDRQIDWTSTKEYTLSQQTQKILRGLNQPVRILAFFSRDDSNQTQRDQLLRAEDMLGRYQRETNQLQVEFVDPIEDPQRRQEYDIRYMGTIVFEKGDRRESVTTVDEQKFTTAIMRVLREEIKKVYFLAGHGEADIEDSDEQFGLSEARTALEAQNYDVQKLPLAAQPSVPSDCAVLVLASPRKAISQPELGAIQKYLESGGKLLVMLDAPEPSTRDVHNGLIALLARWGVQVRSDVVIDQSLFGYMTREVIPFVQQYEFHTITKDLPDPTAFPLVRSVDKTDKPVPDITVTSLAKTSPAEGASWGETEWQGEEWRYDPASDTAPPVSLAVAMQREREAADPDKPKLTDTRMVVVGDSGFATNWGFSRTGGGDFFLNSLNWLTEEEDLISIRAKPPEQRRLRALSKAEERLVALTSVFAMPFVVALLGLGVWWWRRKLT